MVTKRSFYLFCVGTSLLLITGAVSATKFYYKRINELTAKYRYECPMHLLDLWGVTMALAREKDSLPQDLTFVDQKVPVLSQSNMRLRLSPILCPASEFPFRKEGAVTNVPDYIYINWSTKYTRLADIPGDYPLAYDRTLSNHLGKGVYVLKVNGSVIWDAGAEWIREFSARNSALHIALPQ